jgi:hypothetical protein
MIDMPDYIKRNTALHIKSPICSTNRLTTFTTNQAQYMGTPPFNVVLPRVHYGLLFVFACKLPLLAERERKSRTVSPASFARSAEYNVVA